MAKLKPGTHITRTKLGITKLPGKRASHVVHNGEQYLFVSIRNKGGWLNELHRDGVVHEPADAASLLPYGAQNDETHKGRNIMVRFNPVPGSPYEYVGKERYTARHDTKRNKVFLEEEDLPEAED